MRVTPILGYLAHFDLSVQSCLTALQQAEKMQRGRSPLWQWSLRMETYHRVIFSIEKLLPFQHTPVTHPYHRLRAGSPMHLARYIPSARYSWPS
jgi:hypothetical protein